MPLTLKLLTVGSDAQLRQELDSALAGEDIFVVVHSSPDYRQGIEALRARRPDLVLVEMGRDLRSLKVFAEESAAASPETVVAAVFRPEVFGGEDSESHILIAALRAGVRDFLRRPLAPADLRQLLERIARPAPTTPSTLGVVSCFLSNKGGVGKSTLAVNSACGLAGRHPERVLLVDVSLQLGVCSSLLDVKPKVTLADIAGERDRLDETLLRQMATPHACGLHLLAAPSSAVEAGEVTEEVITRVLTLARRAYDYVIIDSFPLLDSVMLAVLDLCDRMYLVVESVVPTILGGVKLLQLLDGLGFPHERQRIILNRYSRYAGNLPPEDVAEHLGRPIDHVVPYEKKLLIAANLGRPHILERTGLFGRRPRAFWEIVEAMDRVSPSKTPARLGSQSDE